MMLFVLLTRASCHWVQGVVLVLVLPVRLDVVAREVLQDLLVPEEYSNFIFKMGTLDFKNR